MPSSAACATPEMVVAPDDALRHESRRRAVRLEPMHPESPRPGGPGAERSGAFVGRAGARAAGAGRIGEFPG